ncbi:MAG: hypothetical protein HFF17_05835 [Oscillospiraceae bacterium]|nr:hypothetical protein [Oscillospiraceae bacterium]
MPSPEPGGAGQRGHDGRRGHRLCRSRLIFTSDWALYNQRANKQGFWEITPEALEQYAPLTAQSMYPDAWEQAKVGGKIYMLPMNYKEIYGHVFMVRSDLMQKYGITKIGSMEDMEAYMDAIAQNESGRVPLDIGSDTDNRLFFDYIVNQRRRRENLQRH